MSEPHGHHVCRVDELVYRLLYEILRLVPCQGCNPENMKKLYWLILESKLIMKTQICGLRDRIHETCPVRTFRGPCSEAREFGPWVGQTWAVHKCTAWRCWDLTFRGILNFGNIAFYCRLKNQYNLFTFCRYISYPDWSPMAAGKSAKMCLPQRLTLGDCTMYIVQTGGLRKIISHHRLLKWTLLR